jgi:threonine synthase
MDISKASNFERFIFDIVGRDADALRELWWDLDTRGEFHLVGSPYWAAVADSGFVSGSSTHVDRVRTMRTLYDRTGVLIDPHTADGVRVAHHFREPGVAMICLETAAPAKFERTVVEAIGRAPPLPAGYADLEAAPQRFEVMPAEAASVKAFIAARAGKLGSDPIFSDPRSSRSKLGSDPIS